MQQPSMVLSDHTAGAGWRRRARAAFIHLAASLFVAMAVGLLVFAVWYPYPYREISGGRELFLLVIAVDVALGPLLTLIVFDQRKPRAELRRDVTLVALVQLAALGYGLWTVQLARPVYLVFELDRFRVVHRADIPAELESKAPEALRGRPWSGPAALSIRPFQHSKERFEYTMAAMQGLPLAARPELWEPYSAGEARILAAARPLSELQQRFPSKSEIIETAVRGSGRQAAVLLYLPLVSRAAEVWTILLDAKTAEIVGFLPLDSF